jgi:flagellar motility protein MotE (MotC chaperone)
MSGTVLVALTAVIVLSGWGVLMAQDAGQGDRGERPREGATDQERQQRMEQARQRMNDRMREQLGFSQEEWQAVQPLFDKVVTLQRPLRAGASAYGGMGMAGGRGGPGGRGDTGGPGGPGGRADDGGRQRPQAPADESELGKARQKLTEVTQNTAATSEQLQEALKGYREARTKAQKELEQSQKNLREVVNTRQEAQLVLWGTLD